jgi:hypothetical protein
MGNTWMVAVSRRSTTVILTSMAAALLCFVTSSLVSFWPRLAHSAIAQHQAAIRLAGFLFLMIELSAIGRQREREQRDRPGADL